MISKPEILNAKILIVDDQDANVRLLEQMLSDGVIPTLPQPWILTRFADSIARTAMI